MRRAKRFWLFSLCFLFLAVLPGEAAQAQTQAVPLEEIGCSLELPASFLIFTKGLSLTSPAYENFRQAGGESGFVQAALQKENFYLSALSPDFLTEYTLYSCENAATRSLQNLGALSQKKLSAFCEKAMDPAYSLLPLGEAETGPVLSARGQMATQRLQEALYLCYSTLSMQGGDFLYEFSFFTVINGREYLLTVHHAGQPLTEAILAGASKVCASLRFSAPLAAPEEAGGSKKVLCAFTLAAFFAGAGGAVLLLSRKKTKKPDR